MDLAMNGLVVVVGLGAAGALAFAKPLRESTLWRATVTPLASIMGSGFLVSAPLIAAIVGGLAPVAMAVLLVLAFGLGAIVRFNIRYGEPVFEDADGADGDDPGDHRHTRGHAAGSRPYWAQETVSVATRIEQASHLVLSGAYVISVTYYLGLLASFLLDGVGVESEVAQRGLVTAVLVSITAIGVWRGLKALEGVERYAVALNLGLVTALIVALGVFDVGALLDGSFALPAIPQDATSTDNLRRLMGLLIVVQGFETSRFLGDAHPPEERIRSMRYAQLGSAAIYVVFIALAMGLFSSGVPEASVTAIVGLVEPVAAVLPVFIVIAAVGSQFSAAVADDAGCSGLLATTAGRWLPRTWSYVLTGAAAVALTWLTDVMSVLSYASRAFAVYYMLQCIIAVALAATRPDARGRWWMLALGVVLALVSAGVAILGIPAEG